MLILPGDPEFNEILATPPPNWGQVAARLSGAFAFVARADSGILEPVSMRELDDYIEGGEYDVRLGQLDDEDFEPWDG